MKNITIARYFLSIYLIFLDEQEIKDFKNISSAEHLTTDYHWTLQSGKVTKQTAYITGNQTHYTHPIDGGWNC